MTNATGRQCWATDGKLPRTEGREGRRHRSSENTRNKKLKIKLPQKLVNIFGECADIGSILPPQIWRWCWDVYHLYRAGEVKLSPSDCLLPGFCSLSGSGRRSSHHLPFVPGRYHDNTEGFHWMNEGVWPCGSCESSSRALCWSHNAPITLTSKKIRKP